MESAATWELAPGRGPPPVLPAWLTAVEQAAPAPLCALCDCVFTTVGDLDKHLSGARHARRCKQLKRQSRRGAAAEQRRPHCDPPSSGRSYCGVCLTFANSPADAANHRAGKRHMRAAAAAAAADADTDSAALGAPRPSKRRKCDS